MLSQNLVFLVHANPGTCIIVHVHNPEGVEIASIQGMDKHSVCIYARNLENYDYDFFVGYGAYDEETHNKPIEIRPGEYEVRVEFNGMTLSDWVDIQEGETKVLTFTFGRAEFDLSSWISGLNYRGRIGIDGVASISGSVFLNATEGPYDYDEVYDYDWNVAEVYFNAYIGGGSSGGPSYAGESSVAWSCTAAVTLTAFSYYEHGHISFSCSGTTGVDIESWACFETWGLGSEIPIGDFASYSGDIDYWFVQSIQDGYYPSVVVWTARAGGFELFGDPWNSLQDNYTLIHIPSIATYDHCSIEKNFGGPGYRTRVPQEYDMSLANDCRGSLVARMSSVPYDLTGTGVKNEENQPPVASFTYSEQSAYAPSGIIGDGVNLMGKKVIVNTSSSYDPDGTITEMYFTVESRYVENNAGWPSWNCEDTEFTRFSAYFPREDYKVTLHVRDNDGLWSETTQTIGIHLYPALLSTMKIPSSGTMTIKPGFIFAGGLPQLLVIYYKHDGEYYYYLTNSLQIWSPPSSEMVFYTRGDYRHEICWSHPQYLPQGAVRVGYIKYDLPNRRIFEAEELGKYIEMLYESGVREFKDVGSGTIKPLETHAHGVNIDSGVLDAIFTLSWLGSDLDLILHDPNGREITPEVAAADPDIDFVEGNTYEQYTVLNPVPGNWTMEIRAIDVPEEGEEYIAITHLLTDDVPPVTLLGVGEPKSVIDNMVYLTSRTPIMVTAEDNPNGSGIASTFYRVYNGTYDTNWSTYTEQFNLTGLADGTYFIDFNSIDYAGNIESTNTVTVVLDDTPPKTTLTIGEPKYITDTAYVNPDTPFTLEATDTGSGVYSTAYKISNSTYDSGWLPYTTPFHLTALTDGAYTIKFNSTDNLGNIETTNSIQVTLFSWNYVFTDSDGRGTILKINTQYKLFQFIAPDKDFGIRHDAKMTQMKHVIIIGYEDKEMRLVATAVDDRIDFCSAIAWDKQTGKRYLLIDKPNWRSWHPE